MATKKISSIDEYHSAFSEDVRKKLEVFRKTIKQVIPKAEEVISYNMPTFKLNGISIVYYSAYKNHISIYPAPAGKAWEKEFAPYPTSGKGTIQFPFGKPIPVGLIKKIVKHRLDECLKKQKKKVEADGKNQSSNI